MLTNTEVICSHKEAGSVISATGETLIVEPD